MKVFEFDLNATPHVYADFVLAFILFEEILEPVRKGTSTVPGENWLQAKHPK